MVHLVSAKFFSPPVSAILTIESSRTWFPAELPTVPRCTGTRAVGLVAFSVDALAVSFTPGPPQPLSALATSSELVTWGVVTVTLDCAVPSRPARIALATACHRITDGVDAAVAVVVALGTPDARVACAFARFLIAFTLLAQARILAVWSPTIVVAGTLTGQVVTLAIGVTITFPLAVRAPELGRALC